MTTRAFIFVFVAASVLMPRNILAQPADLSISFTAQQNNIICPTPPNGCIPQLIPVAPGGQAIFTLLITNSGPAPATNITATMTFPAKTVMHFASPTMSCATSTVAGSPILTCTLPSLAVGTTPIVITQLDIGVDYNSPTLVGSATVVAATADPNPANNTQTATLPVTLPIPTLNGVWLMALALGFSMFALFVLRRT